MLKVFPTLIFLLHRDITRHAYSRQFGLMLICTHIPLTAAYTLLSAHVIASAPWVRSMLVAVNGKSRHKRILPSVLLFNGITLIFIVAWTAGLVPITIRSGRSFKSLGEPYSPAMAVTEAAREKQDMTALLGLLGPLGDLQNAGLDNIAVGRITGILYSSYILVLLVSGVIPAMFLNRAIRRNINKLEVIGARP